jgi:hypothetical protein
MPKKRKPDPVRKVFDLKRPLTRRSLMKFQERVLLAYAPVHLEAAMNSLHRLAAEGDLGAIKAILQMHNMVPTPGAISVTTNIQNNLDAGGSSSSRSFSFDSVVRSLDSSSRQEISPSQSPLLLEASPVEDIDGGGQAD